MIPPHLVQHDVVVYVRGRDGHAQRAVEILRATGVRFVAVDVDADEALSASVVAYSGWPDFPQIFVESEFLGGVDYLEEMHDRGALQVRLRDLPRC